MGGEPESLKQQLVRMQRIVASAEALDGANKEWLMRRLADEECADTTVARLYRGALERARQQGQGE